MKRLANRPTLLQAPAENLRDAWPAWTDEVIPFALAPDAPTAEDLAPRWRSVALTTRGRELDHLDGFGADLVDDLVAIAHRDHRDDLDDAIAAGEAPADFAAACGDQVVWDGVRVVGILRPLADGNLDVARFAPGGFLERDRCSEGGGQ